MTTFTDGPAKGAHLLLRRAPMLLRVAHSSRPLKPKEEPWDALDQLEDEPRQDETLYAYRLVGKPSMCHLRMSDRRRSGFYVIATYAVVEPQPADAEMRTNAAWVGWCENLRAKHPELLADWKAQS